MADMVTAAPTATKMTAEFIQSLSGHIILQLHVPSADMEEEGFTSYTAVSLQGQL